MSWRGRLRAELERRPARALAAREGERRAAVLVAVLGAPPALEVLLHRRAAELRRHPSQVAFPGGIADACDESPAATALREAEEELGLDPRRVELVGRLSDQRTTTGFVVTPVVGLVQGAPELTPRSEEVEAVIRIPVAAMLVPGAFRSATRVVRGLRVSGDVLRWQGDEVWGATARILLALCRILAPSPEGRGQLSGSAPAPARRPRS